MGAIAWTAYASGQFTALLADRPSAYSHESLVHLPARPGALRWAVLPGAILWGASFPLALAAVASRGQEPGPAGRRCLRRQHGRRHRRRAGLQHDADSPARHARQPAGHDRPGRRQPRAGPAVAAPARRARTGAPGRRGGAGGSCDRRGRLARLERDARSRGRSWRSAADGLERADRPAPADRPRDDVLDGRRRPGRLLHLRRRRNERLGRRDHARGTACVSFHGCGKVQASTEPADMRLQRMLGHISALVHPKPRVGPGRRPAARASRPARSCSTRTSSGSSSATSSRWCPQGRDADVRQGELQRRRRHRPQNPPR